jgi:hypothetical protein
MKDDPRQRINGAKRTIFPHHPEANQYLHYRYRDGWNL